MSGKQNDLRMCKELRPMNSAIIRQQVLNMWTNFGKSTICAHLRPKIFNDPDLEHTTMTVSDYVSVLLIA